MKPRLALLFALISSVSSAATVPPKVIFFGDSFTANWPLPSGYINKGDAGNTSNNGLTSQEAAAAFQSDVVSQHPAIVHIMVGLYNFGDDAAYQGEIPGYINDINNMVNEAKAANIKVILGTIGPNFGGWYVPIDGFNAALFAYGATNGIQVVNYHDALCQCVGSTNSGLFDNIIVNGGNVTANSGYTNPYLVATPPQSNFGVAPSAAGYALMTQMAQAAIANLTATLKTGYLQDVELETADVSGGAINVNSVGSGERIQFTPYGSYSDGSTHPQLNANFAGETGTWTSSNPSVIFVSPAGMAWALGAGTATIRYTPPNGVKFSSWVMYVRGQ